MPDDAPPSIDIRRLADRYEGIVLDAYGVLVHAGGAFPGAESLVEFLRNDDVPFVVATNDASRLPSTAAEKYRNAGLDVTDDEVITAGELLAPFFEERDLRGVRTAVLGTSDSVEYARRAGADLVDPGESDFDVLVLGDDAGFDFRPTINATMTRLIRAVRADREPTLVVPNPDMLFQRGPDSYGVAVGSLAAMFEALLDDRFPERNLTFERLGKPHPPIYEEALRRLGTHDAVMLGDQLATDIAGAKRAGLDAALVTWGLDDPEEQLAEAEVAPDFLFEQ